MEEQLNTGNEMQNNNKNIKKANISFIIFIILNIVILGLFCWFATALETGIMTTLIIIELVLLGFYAILFLRLWNKNLLYLLFPIILIVFAIFTYSPLNNYAKERNQAKLAHQPPIYADLSSLGLGKYVKMETGIYDSTKPTKIGNIETYNTIYKCNLLENEQTYIGMDFLNKVSHRKTLYDYNGFIIVVIEEAAMSAEVGNVYLMEKTDNTTVYNLGKVSDSTMKKIRKLPEFKEVQ